MVINVGDKFDLIIFFLQFGPHSFFSYLSFRSVPQEKICLFMKICIRSVALLKKCCPQKKHYS